MRWPIPLPARRRWAWLLGTPLRRFRLRRTFAMLDGVVPDRATILENGAGRGDGAHELARRRVGEGDVWILLDPQRGLLREGRPLEGTAGSPARIVGDGVRLPLVSESVDLELSLGVLCCIEESAIPRALDEMVRVVRPGGHLVLRDPKNRAIADEAGLTERGLVRVRSIRPGCSVFRKPL